MLVQFIVCLELVDFLFLFTALVTLVLVQFIVCLELVGFFIELIALLAELVLALTVTVEFWFLVKDFI